VAVAVIGELSTTTTIQPTTPRPTTQQSSSKVISTSLTPTQPSFTISSSKRPVVVIKRSSKVTKQPVKTTVVTTAVPVRKRFVVRSTVGYPVKVKMTYFPPPTPIPAAIFILEDMHQENLSTISQPPPAKVLDIEPVAATSLPREVKTDTVDTGAVCSGVLGEFWCTFIFIKDTNKCTLIFRYSTVVGIVCLDNALSV
jgi:hypothetical protein